MINDSLTNPDASFNSAVDEVLGEEAGYVNDPNDLGGETKWGISKRAFPNVDIEALSRDDAKALYRANYWDPLLPYSLTPIYRLVAFECAVNQGLGRTKAWIEDSKGQLSWFMTDRAMAYIVDKQFNNFGKGWLRRLFNEVTSKCTP